MRAPHAPPLRVELRDAPPSSLTGGRGRSRVFGHDVPVTRDPYLTLIVVFAGLLVCVFAALAALGR